MLQTSSVQKAEDTGQHPLQPVVQELQRLFGDIMVDLSLAERRSFVDAYLESEPNRFGAGFQEMLYRQTGGHPLFTVELMRGLEEQAALVRDPDGYWVEGPGLDWQTLPARVEAVIASRIDRLPRPLLAALRVASVEGEVFTAEVVARVRRTDDQELLDSLSGELDRRHRLVRAQGIQRMEPVQSLPKEPALSSSKEPALSLPKEPALSLPKEPALSLPKEPALSLPKEPALSLPKEPALSSSKEPALSCRRSLP